MFCGAYAYHQELCGVPTSRGGILLQDMCRSNKKVHVLKLTRDFCFLTVLAANQLLLRTSSARAIMSETDEMLNVRFSKGNQSSVLKRGISVLSFFVVTFAGLYLENWLCI